VGEGTAPGSRPPATGRPAAIRTWPTAIRTWLAGRSLRFRLIAGLLVLFVLAAAGVAAATSAALQPYLLSRLDQQLGTAGAAFTVGNAPHDGDHDDGPPAASGPVVLASLPQQAGPGTLGLCFSHGRLVSAAVAPSGYSGGPRMPRLTAADISTLQRLPPQTPTSVDLSHLGDYRVIALGHGDTMTVTGLPLSGVQATIRQLQTVEALLFGGAVVVIAVIGTAWVRLSLRPLGRITATAREVAAVPLASGEVELPHRVPDADPRTEVGQLGAAFNRMLGHVEAALTRRHASEDRLRRFAADASHELRTPLAAIRGYAELAHRQPERLPEDVEHALRRVESESARMSALVEDLLLLARLDAGRPLDLEPVDLTRLAIDATSDARVAAPGHKWRLDLPDEPVVVTGDGHRLHQALANLLSNAWTHTPAGTTVTVAVTTAPGAVQLSVTDDGPGIPEEMQPGIFERFVRADESRSRSAGGTGLGLSIVAAVTSAHHGTVSVTSSPGLTRFLLTLPAGREGAEQPTGERQP